MRHKPPTNRWSGWVFRVAWLGGMLCGAGACGRSLVPPEPELPPPRDASREGASVTFRVDSHAQGVDEELPEAAAFVKWCASGGAPIVGAPVVDQAERSYVATSDGYVHAFERDGRFRWSYTVKGTPLGSVSLRPSDGAILIGTTGQFIYAINQDGSLRFRYPTLTPVWSGLHALNSKTVVFLGHDERIYAISNEGLRKYRVHAPSAPMGEPVVAPGDVVWLPLVDGLARFEAAFKLDRFPLSAPVEEAEALGNSAVVRAGGRAFLLATDGKTQALGPARFLSGDGERVLLARSDGSLSLLSANGKRVSLDVPKELVAALSAAPALSGDRVWLPLTDGRVVVTDFTHQDPIEVTLKNSALSTPVVGRTGKWALVPSRGGEFCAVEIHREGPWAGVPPVTESF